MSWTTAVTSTSFCCSGDRFSPSAIVFAYAYTFRKLLSTLKEAAQGRNAERAKVKNKDREVSL